MTKKRVLVVIMEVMLGSWLQRYVSNCAAFIPSRPRAAKFDLLSHIMAYNHLMQKVRRR
jgi:hypothetical protein